MLIIHLPALVGGAESKAKPAASSGGISTAPLAPCAWMKLQLCLMFAQQRAAGHSGLRDKPQSGDLSFLQLPEPPPLPRLGFHPWKVVRTQLLVELEHPLKCLTHQQFDAEILL